LERAFNARTSGMSVYKAAREYNVPESTLRDRTWGNICLDAKIGFKTIFTTDEEQQLVDHISFMASIGYEYKKSGIQFMARDFAVSLGKILKSQEVLSNSWFYGFMSRWPNLNLVKPQKLSTCRAKNALKENIDKYFRELSNILIQNNLHDKPERILNIDETGVNSEHSPPKVVCDEDINPQSITSQRSSTTTIIVGGSAVGNYIPSYYIFQGKRWYGELLEGALAGSDGEMSKSGWSKSAIFKNYLTKHFIKHTGIKEGNNETPSLVLYDGHQSHVNLTLKEWPEKRNITLFVLPPHTSHPTQPLDVTMFGPLKSMYNRECQTYLRNNPGINITKHKIAELTAKPYIRALCPENLISGFQKTRIYPLDKSVITNSQLAPSTIYANEDMQNKDNSESDNAQDTEEGHDGDMVVEVTQLEEPPVLHSENIEQHEKESECETLPEAEIIVARNLNTNEIHDEPLPSVTETRTTDTQTVFFEKRTITNAVKKPKHKFQPPFLARSRSKAGNIAILEKMSENAKEKAAKPCENTESTVSTNKKSRLTTNKPKPKNKGKKIHVLYPRDLGQILQG
jgi:hypothetical protein